MSDAEVLTEEDKALLNQLEADIDAAEVPSEYEAIAREIKDEFFQLQTEFRQFQNTVDRRFDEMERKIGDSSIVDEESCHQIHYYEKMDDEEREK